MPTWRRRAALTTLAWLAAGSASLALSDEVKIQTQVNRDRIYLGESFLLTVKVSDGDDQEQPDLSALSDGTFRSLGAQRYRNVASDNGRVTQERFRIFTYEITPAQAGAFRAGPLIYRARSGTLSHDGPVVRVDGIEQQDQVLVRVVPSKESVLVDETFDVTLSVAIEKMQGSYRNTEPLDPADPPMLDVPFLETETIPGLQSPNLRELLQGLLVRSGRDPGLAINNLTVPSSDPFAGGPLSMFAREEKARFKPPRSTARYNGREYWEYTLRLTYTAREERTHTFGPVLFKGTALAGVDAGGYPIGRRIFAVGPACTVRVVPPPEDGRPASFIGAIGTNLTVEAVLDAQTCRVGDPLALTVTVAGGISLDNLLPPNLNAQTNLARRFRVYGDSVKTLKKDGARQFVYTVRPTEAGTYELPPIAVSYFDSRAREYRTSFSQPLPIKAAPAAEVGTETMIDTVPHRPPAGGAAQKAPAASLAPMTLDPAGADPQPFVPQPWHAAAAAAGPLACAALVGYRSARRSAGARSEARRQRSALHRALRTLARQPPAGAGSAAATGGAVCDAMRQYLGDRLGAVGAGLTPDDARRLLLARGGEPELTEQFCALLERNFNAVYAGTPLHGSAPEGDRQACRELLTRMEKALDARGRRGGPE